MKTRTFLAGATALAFAAGTVALPADAGQTLHGGGGHGGAYHGGGHGGAYRVGGAYHGGAYHGGRVYRGGGYGYGGGGYGGGYYGGTAAAADPPRWFSGSAVPTATDPFLRDGCEPRQWTAASEAVAILSPTRGENSPPRHRSPT